MKITDETLSAFLDHELSAREMDAVRDAISEDEALGERLTELASIDASVRQHAAAIDSRPMPKAITALLQDNTVVYLSAWQRSRRFVTRHAAMAASVLLVIGFSAGYISTNTGDADSVTATQLLNASLDSTPSGETVTLANNASLQPRFSFVDQDGQYCRQYQLQGSDSVTENVACRQQNGWQVVATVETFDLSLQEDYRPATGTFLLDSTLDAMMEGNPLSMEEENSVIRRQWSAQ